MSKDLQVMVPKNYKVVNKMNLILMDLDLDPGLDKILRNCQRKTSNNSFRTMIIRCRKFYNLDSNQYK